MQPFTRVIGELRSWLSSISWVNMCLPYALYIMFGSLGLLLLNDVFSMVHFYVSFITQLFSLVGYFGFFFGCLCCLVTADLKWVPYGLFGYAILNLIPFNIVNVYSIVRTLIWAYMGYALLKYTAVNNPM